MFPTGLLASVSGAGIDLVQYARILYWRRWLALSVVAAVVAATAAYTFTAQKIYEGKSTVLIDADEPNVVNFKGVLDEGLTGSGYMETQYELLKSRALAARTVAALGRQTFGASTDAAAVSELLYGLRITPVRGSRLVEVKYRSPWPELAARVATAHAEQYIQQSVENRFSASKSATAWLDAQLAKERKRVEQAEAALQAYREKYDAVSLKSGQDIVVQKLSDLNAAVTRAKAARIEKEVQYREVSAAEHDRALLDASPVILSNAFIQQLKADVARLQREYAQLSETLGDRHPTLIEKRTELETAQRRLSAEISRVVKSVADAYHAAQAEEGSLTRALDEQKAEALQLNRRGIEYATLERDAESVRLVYQSLLQRAKETSVSGDLPATNIRIVDVAQTPKQPVLPRTKWNLFVGTLSGALLAIGVVFVAELLDDRIKTPDDLREHVGGIFLGLVPEVRGRLARRLSLLTSGVPASFVEAFRALRTRVMASTERIVIVASSGEREGKTLVAANLAMSLAEAGQRVLLIDADLRRPSLHEVFGRRVEPGLSNLLDGTSTLADVLRLTTVSGLSVIAGGTPTLRAAELLDSPVFAQLFEIVKEHFTWVVIDSAPVLSVTDTCVLVRQPAGVVFVVGSSMTSARAARLAVEELQRAGARMLGTVLNRADLRRHPFYFSPYSRGDYAARTGPAPDRDLKVATAPFGRRA
jgi:capsular exopolysaccharide synthesis family protein